MPEIRASDGDPEIAAMKAIEKSLYDLDREAVRRVMRWANERHIQGPDDKLMHETHEWVHAMTAGIATLTKAARHAGVTEHEYVVAVKRLMEDAVQREPVEEGTP